MAYALLQGADQRGAACGNGAYGGQRANDQAHIGVEQAGQPGAARIGQYAGFGGEVSGQLALNVLGAVRQLIGNV